MLSFQVSEIRKDLSEIVNRVTYLHEKVILMRRNKRVAALVPIEDLERLIDKTADLPGENNRESLHTDNKPEQTGKDTIQDEEVI